MGIYNSEGIVLNKIPFSNTSLIVSYLTEAHGKVKLVCRGVRGSKKQSGVHFEPGSLVHLEWYKKDTSDLGTLRNCDTSKIKEIGESSRLEIENYLNSKVFLDLKVGVKENWRQKDSSLNELGYSN